ncbi:MAG: magnetochrome domain-containing protein [Magnetococcales bacterium]|nr:magnetochrome domain-containing protein [Magnetococcales bacterium]
MKQLQWFMAISIAFSLVLFFLSVFAEDPWEDHVYNKAPPIAAGMSAPHLDGRERMTCSSCHEIIANNPNSGIASTPPLVDGTPAVASHQDGRDRMPCANCHRILPNPAQNIPVTDAPVNTGVASAPPVVDGTPAVASHQDGRDRMPCANCHRILPNPAQNTPTPVVDAPVDPSPPMVTAPAMRTTTAPIEPATPAGMTVALSLSSAPPRTPASAALDPEWHERFIPTRFQGKIVRVVENSVQSGRVNTHILVYDGINEATWINLAPDWYLNKQGCRIGMGLFVKGTAYKETGSKHTALRYAKSFSVNGQSCTLRDKHLRCAWTGNGLKDQDEE